MKVAVTSQGPQPNSTIDPRFGRAKYFVVLDTDTGEFSAVDNAQNLNAAQGAGIQAAKTVADLRVDAVITGHVGPKAFLTLQRGGVQVFTNAAGTVAEAVEQFNGGKLASADTADVEGHWM